MFNWAYVENEKIEEYHHNLPEGWRNITGLHLSINNIEFLNSIGWYKIVKDPIEYDNNLYYVKSYNYNYEDGQVKENIILESIPEDLIIAQEATKKESFFERLREQRNERLRETDWTELPSVRLLKSLDWAQAYDNYRQALRDFPATFADITENVIWPEKPTLT